MKHTTPSYQLWLEVFIVQRLNNRFCLYCRHRPDTLAVSGIHDWCSFSWRNAAVCVDVKSTKAFNLRRWKLDEVVSPEDNRDWICGVGAPQCGEKWEVQPLYETRCLRHKNWSNRDLIRRVLSSRIKKCETFNSAGSEQNLTGCERTRENVQHKLIFIRLQPAIWRQICIIARSHSSKRQAALFICLPFFSCVYFSPTLRGPHVLHLSVVWWLGRKATLSLSV